MGSEYMFCNAAMACLDLYNHISRASCLRSNLMRLGMCVQHREGKPRVGRSLTGRETSCT